MPAKRLTDASVQKIKPPPAGPDGSVRQMDYLDRLDGGGSLGLRVSSNGVRSWVIQPRVLREGKRVRIRVTLGRYPEMSLATAREKARAALLAARCGQDPAAAVKQERQALIDESRRTFGVLADEFLAKYVGRECRPATEREYRRALKGPDVADWQDRLVAQITKRDVLDLWVQQGQGTTGRHHPREAPRGRGQSTATGLRDPRPASDGLDADARGPPGAASRRRGGP